MVRGWLDLIVGAALVLPAHGQNPTPTPRPPVFSAEASILHVDVIVTDKKGRQITDLRAQDFEIESDGRKYAAEVATYIPLVPAEAGAPLLLVPPGAKPRPEDVRRVITFVVSRPSRDGNLQMRVTRRLESMFRHFIEKDVRPGDLVSIVNMESRKPLFNQLTANPETLSAIVDAFRDDSNDFSFHALPPYGTLDEGARYAVNAAKLAQEAVARMEGLPGRKLLVVIADHLRMTDPKEDGYLNKTHGPNPFSLPHGFTDARKELEELTRQANRAGVTIYSVKTVEQDFARDQQNQPRLGAAPIPMDDQLALPDPGAEPLLFLSDSTGGTTLTNLDLLEMDLSRIMNRNRGYYLLGFDPGEKPNAAARGVRVRVKREGVEVTARPKVFPDLVKPATDAARMERRSLEDAIDSALSAGEIEVRLTPSVDRTGKKGGEFRARIEIDPRSLSSLATRGPSPRAGLEVLWRFRDERATLLQSNRRILGPEDWTDGQTIGFSVEQSLSAPGSYQLDVAVRELGASRMGNASVLVSSPAASSNKKVP